MVVIVTSVEDHFGYYDNLNYLKNGIANGSITFQGYVKSFSPEQDFVFGSKRVYDFTRSAKAKVREEMVAYLSGVLPGIQEEDRRKLREAFDYPFNYYKYKGCLSIVGQQRGETMRMLYFTDNLLNQGGRQYTAHIQFSCNTTKNLPNEFTVHTTLTCQRFTHFPLQQTTIEDVLLKLENVHLE